jgi:hypothetical protein
MNPVTSSVNPEITQTEPAVPLLLRLLAKFVSVLFHPVFVPIYVMYFLVYIHPYHFTGFEERGQLMVMIQAMAMYLLFPMVTVLLLKGLRFIDSIQLHEQKDRIIPLVACGVWYFWIWYVWKNLPDYPAVAVQFALAIWISSFTALMANVKMKISLHAISMVIALTFIILLGLREDLSYGLYIAITIFLTGLVCTSRLLVSDHTQAEVYGGLALGAASALVAGLFV